MKEKWLICGAIALVLLAGLIAGLGPLPARTALWGFSLLGTSIASWFLVRSYGLARGAVFAAITFIIVFAAEYWIVNVPGILTHLTYPKLAGVAVLALTQDYFSVTVPVALAFALFPGRPAWIRITASGANMLVLDLVAGPYAAAVAYYRYAPPFRAWTIDIGFDKVPPVPWLEPIGMVGMAVVAAGSFEAIRRMQKWPEIEFSLTWSAAVFYGFYIMPGWAWTIRQGHWHLFAAESALMLGLAALIVWREPFLRRALRPATPAKISD